MKRLLTQINLSVVAGTLSTPLAHAHERWVEHRLLRPIDLTLFEPCGQGALTAWTLAALVLAVTLLVSRSLHSRRSPLAEHGPLLVRAALGSTLFLFAVQGCFLAPDLEASAGLAGRSLLGLSAGLGLLLALGWRSARVAPSVALLFVAAAVLRPFARFDGLEIGVLDVLCYGSVLGMAAYVALCAGADQDPRKRSAAVAALRLGLGFNLILLGALKFARPELFCAVVQNYPDAFAPFGSLSPEAITLGASTVELLVGLMLVAGAMTRLVAGLLAGLFGGTAFVFHGEVLGHLPLLASAAVLALEGSPGRVRDLRPLARRPDSLGGVLRGALCRPLLDTRALATGTLLLVIGTLAATGHTRSETTAGDAGAPFRPLHLRTEGDSGMYRYIIELDAGAYELQRFFELDTRVVDASTGEPIQGVELGVDITMPHHGHGMLTSPVTAHTGRGLFRTHGCKLHMLGAWRIELSLSRAGAVLDHARLPLRLSDEHAP